MNRIIFSFFILLNSLRCLPHLVIYYTHKNRLIIQDDVEYWLHLMKKEYKRPLGFIYLLSYFPQFRNLFYYRMRKGIYILNLICPQMSTLFIRTKYIGKKLYIAHGFASAIGAESIGNYCHIYQQVTIGYSKTGGPTIKDNVIIRPGAIIIGKITIGNNVVIGAGATIFRDIPDNCTVYPPSSQIMQWNREKSNLHLDQDYIDEN